MMKSRIKLAIGDDDDIYRKVFCSYIKAHKDIELIIEVANGKEMLDALQQSQKPDIILLDVEMPLMDGRETLDYLCEKHPDIKVLMLTVHNDDELFNYLMGKGATGFIPKEIGFALLIEAIYAVKAIGHYFANVDLKSILAAKKFSIPNATCLTSFTKREIEIIKLISQGKSNKEISDKLFISLRTVEGHKANMLKKAGVRNASELTAFAAKNNL